MGNGSSNEGSDVCTGKDAPGLNQYCYTAGYDAGKQNTTPDPVGESFSAIPCLTNAQANACYAQGFKDCYDSTSEDFPNRTSSYDHAKECRSNKSRR
jgi:hypothetical protein